MKNEYCPNGSYWEDVSGIFDKRIYMFCDCNICKGKVYELRPIDVTKKATNEQIKGWINRKKLREIKGKITTKNMDKVLETLKEQPSTD